MHFDTPSFFYNPQLSPQKIHICKNMLQSVKKFSFFKTIFASVKF